jgi:hypothetical protein
MPSRVLEGCFNISTVFSHAQTVVICNSCSSVLCQPTGGRARLTEGEHRSSHGIHPVLNTCTREFISSEELSTLCHVSTLLAVHTAPCTLDTFSFGLFSERPQMQSWHLQFLIPTLGSHSDTPLKTEDGILACMRASAHDRLKRMIPLSVYNVVRPRCSQAV